MGLKEIGLPSHEIIYVLSGPAYDYCNFDAGFFAFQEIRPIKYRIKLLDGKFQGLNRTRPYFKKIESYLKISLSSLPVYLMRLST